MPRTPFWSGPMKQHRNALALSRSEAAKAIGIGNGYYGMIESGKLCPGPKLMMKFCDLTGMDKNLAMTLIGRPTDDTIQKILEATGVIERKEQLVVESSEAVQ